MEKKYLTDLENAEEFLNVARDVLDSSIKTSANRLYFALEKAVSAYLDYKGRDIPKNHQKLWEFSNELLGEEYYQALRKLYDLRMQADYGLMSVITPLNSEIMKEAIETERIPFAQTLCFSSRESKWNSRGAQELQARSGIYSGVLDKTKHLIDKISKEILQRRKEDD